MRVPGRLGPASAAATAGPRSRTGRGCRSGSQHPSAPQGTKRGGPARADLNSGSYPWNWGEGGGIVRRTDATRGGAQLPFPSGEGGTLVPPWKLETSLETPLAES